MKKKQSQLGSAHLITIIILVVALLGALGYIYWQNFMQSKTSTSNNTTTTVTSATVALDKSINENVTGSNLTLNYPSDWSVSSVTGLNPSQQTSNTKMFITSPDDNIKVTFWAGVDGIGGTCGDPADSTITNLATYPIANYSGYTLYESTISFSSGGYSAVAEVLKNDSKIQTNASACELGLGFFGATNGTINQVSVSFNNNLSASMTTTAIDTVRATDNYKTAIKIIQSLHEQ